MLHLYLSNTYIFGQLHVCFWKLEIECCFFFHLKKKSWFFLSSVKCLVWNEYFEWFIIATMFGIDTSNAPTNLLRFGSLYIGRSLHSLFHSNIQIETVYKMQYIHTVFFGKTSFDIWWTSHKYHFWPDYMKWQSLWISSLHYYIHTNNNICKANLWENPHRDTHAQLFSSFLKATGSGRFRGRW